MTSTPEHADPRLLEAHDLALAALAEITPSSTVGPAAGYRLEDDGVVSLRFENLLAGYPGWFWTVSLARVEGADPTVLEAELLPSESALLAPDWVPWSVRLAEYQAQQSPAEQDGDVADDAEDDDLAEIDDLDAADFDRDGSPILHAGDVDGVDIDTLDEDAPADDLDEDAGEDADPDEDADRDQGAAGQRADSEDEGDAEASDGDADSDDSEADVEASDD